MSQTFAPTNVANDRGFLMPAPGGAALDHNDLAGSTRCKERASSRPWITSLCFRNGAQHRERCT
jgi:hypothetical protein